MRVVFSKTDALGDQLLATGTVAALLERLPEAQVVWLVRSGYESIYRLLVGARVFRADTTCSSPHEAERLSTMIQSPSTSLWDRVVFVPMGLNAYGPHPTQRSLEADTLWWLEFVKSLRADCAIAGTVTLNWVDRVLVAESGAMRRVGYRARAAAQLVPPAIMALLESRGPLANFTDELAVVGSNHEGEYLARLAEPLTGAPGFAEIRLQLDVDRAPVGKAPHRIILAPGAGDRQRVYPLKQLASAVIALHDANKAADFVVLQGPQDEDVCSLLVRELSRRGLRVETFHVDPRDPREAARLLSSASLLICNDSFWVHLASAVGTPTVAVWGLGHWGRFVSRQGHVTGLHTEMLCQQCNWLCCFPVRHCIIDIPFGAIVEAAQERLSKSGALCPVIVRSIKSRLQPETIRDALTNQLERQSAEGQGHIDTLTTQLNQLAATSGQQTKHILMLEAERDRLTAETNVAQTEVNRAFNEGQKHIDALTAQLSQLAATSSEQTRHIKILEAERDRLTVEAKAAQTEASRASREGQKYIDALTAQLAQLSTTSIEQTKHIKVLEAERDRLTAETKAAQTEANRASKDGQKHIDTLMAQINQLAATSVEQAKYIKVLEAERDRLNAECARMLEVVRDENSGQ